LSDMWKGGTIRTSFHWGWKGWATGLFAAGMNGILARS
jgi:hypothetical protein